MRARRYFALCSMAFAVAAACSAGGSGPGDTTTGGSGNGNGSGSGDDNSDDNLNNGDDDSLGGSAGSAGGDNLAGAGGAGPCMPGGGSDDEDKDGWTPDEGDCNDCDPLINPGAYDGIDYVIDANGNPTSKPLPAAKQIDQNCDGKAAQLGDKVTCDEGLPIKTSNAPFNAVKAMDLCVINVAEKPADPKQRTWGVIDAKFSDIKGPYLQTEPAKWITDPQAGAIPGSPGVAQIDVDTGVLPSFGAATKPQAGVSMFGISSGQARAPGQQGFDKGWACEFQQGIGTQNIMTAPDGFPKATKCSADKSIPYLANPFDGIALDVRIRVPTNAKGLAFQYRYFTCEYPRFTCSAYDDVFAVLVDPYPGGATSKSQNPLWPDVAYDKSNGNVISVNNANFLTSCVPGESLKYPTYDPLEAQPSYPNCVGTADLKGTGYDNNGGSSWLESEFPVQAGSTINMRIAVWDSGDDNLDTTVMVDHFHWILFNDVQAPVPVQTTPVKNPIH